MSVTAARAPGDGRADGYGCPGDGGVDEDGGDGGGGGEGFAVEDSGAGRGAVDEQRQLFAELFGVDGAGFAGGFGEPRGDGFLVVTCASDAGCWGSWSSTAAPM